MPSARVLSAAVVGLTGVPVEVEADIAPGLPACALVGLPDAAVKESRDRVRAAIANSGVAFPRSRVTVNLAPADLRKEGPAFDLPIAVAILLAAGRVEFEREDGEIASTAPVQPTDPRTLFLGELGLDGSVRPITGVLPVALAARSLGATSIVLPAGNAAEASAVGDLTLLPVHHLREVISHLTGQAAITPHVRAAQQPAPPSDALSPNDLAYVAGLKHAKRALEIAAAGSHNLLLIGPPGTGKSLLARAIPTILPPLTPEEQIEVTLAYSVIGLAPTDGRLMTERPYRSPHHTASDVAIVGGGAIPRPGEATLSHRGVLFMDEFPEFSRSVIESLRQPLEDGRVTVSRAAGSMTFPARFQLVAAANPCPCGFWRDTDRPCVCAPGQILRYQQRLSGPILDRLDLVLDVPRQPASALLDTPREEPSAAVRGRVTAARDRQRERGATLGLPLTNAELSTPQLRTVAPIDRESRDVLLRATERFHLSPRATIRTLRVARTIADLAGDDGVTARHIEEALSYRPKLEAAT